MNFQIQNPTLQDIPAIIELMREFAIYENLLEYLEVTENDLQQVLFGADAFVRSLIVFDGQTPIAYAFFYPTFSSFRGQKSVYLEDIYVSENYRQYGLGEKMLRHIARLGKEFGAVRMDFQVLKWNTPAISFYNKHGAVMDTDERHFKFTDEAFANLSSKE